MTEANFDLKDTISKAYDDQLKKRGTANILIAGKSGVGKSTLINEVFQGRLAATGQGRPVTKHTQKYTKKGIPVSIYDTKGLEVKDYTPIIEELNNLVKTTNKDTDPQNHIHVAWICIAEGSRRVEEAEIELAKSLSDHMPVIVVITTAVSDGGFRREVQDLIPFAANVVRVNSLPYELDEGSFLPVKGLEDLIDLTMEVIPEGQKKAFAAAQHIQMSHKLKQAHVIVAGAALTAGGIAATPIPFSDAVAIVPIQIGMLTGISLAFGLDVDKAFIGTLVSGTFTGVAASLGGRALVGALLKFVPGANIAGSVISGSVAAVLTTTFGEAYIATIHHLLKDDLDKELTAEEIAQAFKEKLKK